MSTSLTDLQTKIADLAQQANISITSASHLVRLNRVIRNVAVLHKWPEFRRVDTSLSTVASQEPYTIPASPVFFDITNIEVQDPDDDSRWKAVVPAMSEITWRRLASADASFPEVYLLGDDGTNDKVYLRPNPSFAGTNNIRITGYVEPNYIDNVTYTNTEFRGKIADEAVAELFAADLLDRRVALRARAQTLFESARTKISRLVGREVKPEELHIPKE